jgi:DNA-binding MarR family transcriptional regulator
MAPESVQNEAILPQAAIMCHIMLLHSVLERSANRVVEAHGLTFPQWMALGCIGHCGEQGIRHSELGNRLMVSKAPVTGVVDRLERGGYVRRAADDKDRRVSRVVITPEGDAAWKQVRQTLREHSIKACAVLSSEEQTMFLNILSRLLEDVSQSDPILSTPLDD